MEKIAVLVDSSSNVTQSEQAALNMYAVNAPILVGERVYHENVDWQTQTDFFKFQSQTQQPLTTSQVEIGAWLEKFAEIAADGYTDVIVVTISSGISGTFSTVESLSATVDSIHIHAWDSRIAAAGAGNQARLAAYLAQSGAHLNHIFEQLTRLRDSTHVLFVVDDVKHLKRTGRISNSAAFLGTMMNIKPMLTFNPLGQIIAIDKVRQMKRAWVRIQQRFVEEIDNQDQIRISIIDANNPEIADEWAATMRQKYENFAIERGPIGAFIGVHTGEKALGFIWALDWQKLI
ncbi:DegV family protein [Weissella diestrammenae]|uniref:DegV family protein n=1 Tax=Weissella diestrammenae TaxID=1162633 RepID=A0A7G9T650_9LACO|nr:DegV family protein [Weissella diestrammenae]MCM0582414.1 DegV family protein [Weissella diestrammenae]QNN75575.1 DegV family protein [Weissella diestrammenae]